ncbi:cell wall-binding repeat-containing protein [Clostridium sp. MSJ-11]|uniref:Cell wall-binding repeat-containing protein n=1 Tax=Clostridium mobile TaxID=2841512 RepID=A0ABS6EKN7_9CLOT|nr:cell wall-binding repeat-containing protein [Clostridium mobile]MBU5485778.1 cell wall-binding repeat-containing protein [Clostridium mobile]
MHKSNKKILSICTMASVLLTSSLTTVKVSAANPPENPRLWGSDRYETALKISKEGWTSSEYVVVASGEGYADALSAAPLAKANNAPIILTQRDKISEDTLKELKRLGAKHVYIVGGHASVSKEVEGKIKALGTSIERLDGKDRYETSVKIAKKLGNVNEAIVASGEGYADALSAAPVAAIKGVPVLLTKVKELPGATKEYLKSSGITTTYVIGGTASVNDGVMKILPNAKRVHGQDRFQTNAAVLKAFATEFDFANAYMALASGATGNEFADALAGSALAAKKDAPVILTGKTLSDSTKEVAREKLSPTSTVTILGGAKNVADSVVDSIKITAEAMDKEGATFEKDVNGNAVITAKNITVKSSTIKGDLYVEGTKANLSNLKVEGTVYINPGKDGETNLDGVQADSIVVLSGAEGTVRLKNVKTDRLNIISRTNTRVLAESGTEIKSTSALSSIILEGAGGSFGNINIPKTVLDKTVELRGTISKPVVVEGNVTLKGSGSLSKVEIRSGAEDVVNLQGSLGTVEVYTAADIKVAAGATGTIKAMNDTAKNSAKIYVPSGTSIKVEGFNEANVTGPGAADAIKPSTSTGGGSSSSGGGSTKPTEKKVYDLVFSNGAKFRLGKEDDTIKSVYNNKRTALKDAEVQNKIITENIVMELDKVKKATVGEEKQNIVEYVIKSLRNNNPTSQLATDLEAVKGDDKDGKDLAKVVLNYVADKDFKTLYEMLEGRFNKIPSDGEIKIPAIAISENNTIEKITVTLDATSEKPVIFTKTVNGGAFSIKKSTLEFVRDEFKITESTTLEDLRKIDVKVEATTKKGATYSITVNGGKITIDYNGRPYTIELKVAE